MAHAPDDELLSALLDGEADEDAAAHVAACAECSQRLAVLRNASAALKAPVGFPAGHIREAALARAVQSAAAPAGAATGGSKLLRMSAARRGADQQATPRRMSMLSAAAVLVVVLLVGGFAIAQLGSGSDNASNTDTFAATPTAGDGGRTGAASRNAESSASDTASALAAPAGGAADDATSLAADVPSAYAAGDIGRFTSIDDVSARARANLQADDVDQHQSLEPSPCALPDGSQLIWHGTLYFQNTPAVAIVRTTASSQWVLEIRNPAASGCGLLASQDFEPTTPR